MTCELSMLVEWYGAQKSDADKTHSHNGMQKFDLHLMALWMTKHTLICGILIYKGLG